MERLEIIIHNRAITIFYCHLLLVFFFIQKHGSVYFLIQARCSEVNIIIKTDIVPQYSVSFSFSTIILVIQ